MSYTPKSAALLSTEDLEGKRFSLTDIERSQTLDSQISVESPDGAVLALRPAGFMARGLAFVVDEIVKIVLLFALSLGLGVTLPQSQDLQIAIFLISWFVINWFYGVIFELFNDGATPGRALAGTKAVNADGTAIKFQASVLRNLFRILDSLPIIGQMFLGIGLGFGLPGALFILGSKEFRRIGDHIGDTLVIYSIDATTKELEGTMERSTLPFTLTPHEENLILEFQTRHPKLSTHRQIEIAEIFEPLHHLRGESAVQRCLEYANDIRGRS